MSWEYLDKRITELEKSGGFGGIGTETIVGGVKSSNENNKIKILEDGTMMVNPISVNKLFSESGEEMVFSGGQA